MIKTMSFSSARGKKPSSPSSKSTARAHAPHAAARPAAPPTLAELFDAPAPTPEISAAQAREQLQKAGKPAEPPAKKSRRPRVPANLAEQYGQNVSKRVENGAEAVPMEEEAPKKRRSRAETAARREMMVPDDDLRARLLRAQNIVPARKTEKRPVGWRFDCGRCGRTSYFQTGGALCACGALAIKE